jgi:hypothetical protein
MKPTELLDVLKRQHEAIDMLMAERAALDRRFVPSKSGAVWDAVVAGHNAILRLEAEIKGLPTFQCPRCQRVSFHPKDVEYGYCGACHDFTASQRPEPLGAGALGAGPPGERSKDSGNGAAEAPKP